MSPPVHRNPTRVAVLRVARARPGCSAETIAAVVGCHASTVRRHLSDIQFSPDTSPHVVEIAVTSAATADPQQLMLADQSQAPRILRLLANATDTPVRAAVMSNPSCPEVLRLRGAIDGSRWVRQCAVRRIAHPAALARAATDPDPYVRAEAASNSHSPERLLYRLATDPDPQTRRAVINHPKRPPDIIAALMTDPDPVVRRDAEIAARSPARPRGRRIRLRGLGVARWWGLRRRLRHFAADPDPRTRRVVAGHPQCPRRVRRCLANDLDEQVRELARRRVAPRA